MKYLEYETANPGQDSDADKRERAQSDSEGHHIMTDEPDKSGSQSDSGNSFRAKARATFPPAVEVAKAKARHDRGEHGSYDAGPSAEAGPSR